MRIYKQKLKEKKVKSQKKKYSAFEPGELRVPF